MILLMNCLDVTKLKRKKKQKRLFIVQVQQNRIWAGKRPVTLKSCTIRNANQTAALLEEADFHPVLT